MFFNITTKNPSHGVIIVVPTVQNEIINLITAYHFEIETQFFIGLFS